MILEAAALWASHTKERNFSGGYGVSELQRKTFSDQLRLFLISVQAHGLL